MAHREVIMLTCEFQLSGHEREYTTILEKQASCIRLQELKS